MNIIEKIKNLFRRNKDIPKLAEQNNITENYQNEFRENLKNTSKTSEEIEVEEKNTAINAAYMCLAKKALGYEKEFNTTDHLGESMSKTCIRLQAEETYKNYGHGIELPTEITDEVLKTFQIIGCNFSQIRNNESSYGNPINELMNEKNLKIIDLENILLEKGKDIANSTIENFKNNKEGIGFLSFNLDYEATKARKTLDNSIKEAFGKAIEKNEITK